MGEWVLQHCFGVARGVIACRILEIQTSVKGSGLDDGANLQI